MTRAIEEDAPEGNLQSDVEHRCHVILVTSALMMALYKQVDSVFADSEFPNPASIPPSEVKEELILAIRTMGTPEHIIENLLNM